MATNPKGKLYNGILVGVPTFGMVNIGFAMNQATTATPIFATRAYISVIGKPVDVARNEIAATAIQQNYGFVWFRDDDVLTPVDALVKLLGRMSPEQKAKPRELAECIVGGVVYSKSAPPTPMIFKRSSVSGFEDWNFGDLVECDVIGMGATLIPVGVFNKLVPLINERQCVNDSCSVNWGVTYTKDESKCPHCCGALVPVFFKTVRGEKMNIFGRAFMTEDTYFCLKLEEIDAKVYADCGVQCRHINNDNGVEYYYHTKMKTPVWEDRGKVNYWATMRDVKRVKEKVAKQPKQNKNGKVRFNLGCGGEKRKGYINVDATTDCDFKADVRDIAPVVSKYGQADEIIAKHVLEHINRTGVISSVRSWLKALKPGGTLIMETPDAVAAMKDFIDANNNGSSPADYDFKEQVIFGKQRYEFDTHLTAITENKMESILASCDNLIEKFTLKRGRPRGKNQDVIRVRVIKKKQEALK